MVRVAVMDGCPLIREGLKGLLKQNNDVAFSWELDDPTQLLERLSKCPVQLLLIEPFVNRNGDALRLLAKLHQEFQKTSLLVYTHLPGDDFAVDALRAGVAGVLKKTCPLKEISSALHTIASGKTYLSPAQAHQLSLHYLSNGDRKPDPSELSPREQEVLDGIASGKRLKEIGADLSLSPKTVHTYKTRIMVRFKLTSNVALIQLAHDRT
jgi:DNA-binding NarL/FixJ family response regulator